MEPIAVRLAAAMTTELDMSFSPLDSAVRPETRPLSRR
jgi:hypothetical protein